MTPPETIAPEMIDCIAQGRAPSAEELDRVACRIWKDIAPYRSAFAWGRWTDDGTARLLTRRAAEAALSGNRAR